MGAAQITAAIHDGATFDMDWRGGESDRLRSSTVSHGRVHIGDGRLPLWVRCSTSPSFFAFAVEASFVTEIWRKGFDGIGDCFIGTSVGIEDPVIGRLELNEGGAGGRLYVEGLASALAVHLLRSSGLSRHSSIPHKGGLAPDAAWLAPARTSNGSQHAVHPALQLRQAGNCQRTPGTPACMWGPFS